MNLTEIRQKYPQYDNLSDEQLVIGLHKKYYPQMDFNDFAQRVGYRSTPEQMPEDSTDWIDTANNTLRTIGGAVEAFDKGRYFGLGKRAGGLANAILSWPVDRVAGLMGVENTPTFGDRYNEIVQGAKEMNKEFAENHPVANFGLELAGGIKPANAITRGLAQKGVKSALGQSALGGGIGGSLYAADESDKLSDLPVNTIVGGVGGTVGGAALHSAISGIGTVGGLLRSNVKKGMDYLRSKFGDAYVDNMIREAEQKGLSLAEVADDRALKAVQMARQQTSAADDIITQNVQAIRDDVSNKNTETLNDMFGTKSGYRMAQEAEQAAMEKARPMFNDLEAYGDLDPLYVKPGEKIPTGKLSKEQADELLKSEMQKVAAEEMPVVTRYKGGDDIAVAKSIRRNMSKEDPNFQWRKDENGNYDYEHFVKDPTRAEYLRTMPSTYKNPQYDIMAPNKDGYIMNYLLREYNNPEIGKNVYDKIVKNPVNGMTVTKFAREGKHGLREFEKVFEKRLSPQVSEAGLGLSQTGNTPSSTLRVDNNIPSLGAVVNSNNVINSAIKSVKGAYSSLKELPDTDARVILETRKLLSRQTKSPDATIAFQAKQALKEFDDALPTDFREGLKKANKIYKDNYQFAEARKSAKDIFNKEISPEEFNDKFGKMTAEEKQALRGGLRDELFSIVENRTNETLGWNRVVPRAVQSKIRRVLGVKDGDKLIEYAQSQLKSIRNSNKILSGSQTSEKQNLRDIASTGQRILDNPTGILGAVSRMIPWNNARNMGIARIMTNPSADLARSTYEQAISPQGWEAVYQALYNPRGFTKYNTALAAYLAGRELQQ